MSAYSRRCPLRVGVTIAAACIATAARAEAFEGTGRALLIGCTEYELPAIQDLSGSNNSIPLWRSTLIERFGFVEEEITALVGWPDDPGRRPTRDNVARAFEELIGRVGPGDQVAVVLTGHGVQAPAPAGHDEDDGLEEVFLTADVGMWARDEVPGGLVDDQIGEWLRRLRSKGAHVWAVFDCCHSGTISRGVGEGAERAMSVDWRVLGIPEAVMAAARRRAEARAGEDEGPALAPAEDAGGSLVAFYAAQPFEKTYELARPRGAPGEAGNIHSLYSFSILTTLARARGPITYLDLERAVAALYAAERGAVGPTPFVEAEPEGDRDRQVLGRGLLPRADLVLGPNLAPRTVSGGELIGVRRGTVLAVHPPAGDGRPRDDVLGHVRVVEAGLADSTVEPAAFGSAAAVDLDDLPQGGRCEVVSAGIAAPGLRLAVVGPDPGAVSELDLSLEEMPEEWRALIERVDEPADASWWLIAGPDAIRLRSGAGVTPGPAADWDDLLAPDPRGVDPVVRRYERGPGLAAELGPDLAKLARWQDLWRVLEPMGDPGDPSRLLGLELYRCASRDDPGPSPLGPEGLTAGDWLEVRLVNEGRADLWVTVLYLDARFRIAVIPAVSVRRGTTLSLKRMRMTEPFGGEGLVALGLPQREYRDRPDFGMLVQGPLGGDPISEAATRGDPGPTPFVALLNRTTGPGRTRDVPMSPRTDPLVATARWVTAPASGRADPP